MKADPGVTLIPIVYYILNICVVPCAISISTKPLCKRCSKWDLGDETGSEQRELQVLVKLCESVWETKQQGAGGWRLQPGKGSGSLRKVGGLTSKLDLEEVGNGVLSQ